jgi:hypothetical protein
MNWQELDMNWQELNQNWQEFTMQIDVFEAKSA